MYYFSNISMTGVDYLAQLANVQATNSVYVKLVSGGWVCYRIEEIWQNVGDQLTALKRGDEHALMNPQDIDFAELCYKQLTGGSFDVLVRFNINRPGAYEPDHDAILRLYLGERCRRTWHLPGNVATFAILMDPMAPLRNPNASLFSHMANKLISELSQSAAGIALGSPERRALFDPMLQLVRHRMPAAVDESGQAEMEAAVLDLIDRAV